MTFSMNGVAKRMFAISRHGLGLFAAVTLLGYLAPRLLLIYALQRAVEMGMGDVLFSDQGFKFLSFAFLFLNFALNAVHMSATTEIALRIGAGKPVKLSKVMLNALINIVPVVVIGFFLGGMCVIGCALLIAPGLFLGTVFSVVIPAYVGERKGIIHSFARSYHLTVGYRVQIGLVWSSLFIISFLLAADFMFPDLAMVRSFAHRYLPFWIPGITQPPQTYSFLAASMSTTLNTIVHTVEIIFNCAIYLSLRFEKAVKQKSRIEEVFD